MSSFLPKLQSHLKKVAAAAIGPDGTDLGPMWPAVVDVKTGRCVTDDHAPKRVYRLIGAPRGSTLYWDQPLVVAAYALAELMGEEDSARAADAYFLAFLKNCVAPTGMFQWGNHQYFDLFERKVVGFTGGFHELRPITPAWDLFWRHDSKRTETYMRSMALRHVYDHSEGAFNRHDDGGKSHAFLEAGGILAESLAWLFSKTGDRELFDLALRIARYSFKHRDPSTGLVRNECDKGRWDFHVCTTEIGVWAQCLLRAAEHAAEDEFAGMALDSVRAYLDHGYDEKNEKYYGQVSVDSGESVVPREEGYWPREHANAWTTDQWPTHDYPMALGEACLSLHERTGDGIFRDAIERLARIAMEDSPARNNRWAYAESYGRCIHFLTRAGLHLDDQGMLADASALANEAVDALYVNGMFQGYHGAGVYESVDGVGYLMLALILFETCKEPSLHGFGF